MLDLIRTAVDLGVTFFDTAEIYGPYVNEELVGEALAPCQRPGRDRHQVRLGHRPGRPQPRSRVTSRPEHIRQVVEGSLQRLGRRGRSTSTTSIGSTRTCPIEDVAGAVKELIDAGKVEALRPVRGRPPDHPPRPCRAAGDRAAERVLAVVAPTRGGGPGHAARSSASASCPFSPLGKGFLTGTIDGHDQLRRRERHPQHDPAVRARRAAEQPGPRRSAHQHRRAQRRHPGADRAGLAARAEALDRADPRAPASCTGSQENIGAADVDAAPPTTSPRSTHAADAIHIEGGRYSEAAEQMTNL